MAIQSYIISFSHLHNFQGVMMQCKCNISDKPGQLIYDGQACVKLGASSRRARTSSLAYYLRRARKVAPSLMMNKQARWLMGYDVMVCLPMTACHSKFMVM